MDAVANPIKIIVKGSDNHGGDAPTVKDLFNQILDHLEILREVETAIFGKGQEQLEWRVGDWTKNSPHAIEITPCAKIYGMDIEDCANQVIVATAHGFQELQRGNKKPIHFNDDALKKIKAVNKRVTNGLASTEINFSGYDEQKIFIDKEIAETTIKNIENLKAESQKPYRELGSVEGHVKAVSHDGRGHLVLTLIKRVDNKDVKCIISDKDFEKLELGKAVKGLRVRVFGILHYKVLGVIYRVDVDRVEMFTPPDKLPKIEDLIDHDFTNGVDSVEYIRRRRDNV